MGACAGAPAPIAALPCFVLSGFISLASLLAGAAAPAPAPALQKPSELFKLTNVWTVHLKFTPEQWELMEPKGGGGGPFGGPGGPGRFGPAMLLAAGFLKEGDQNQDGKLSREEFRALSEKWFAAWDKDKAGKLNMDQLRAGLHSTLVRRDFAPPGGGAMGGRPPGMNLQGAEGKRNGLASAMGIEFNYVHADLEFEGRFLKDVAVRYKGNGTFLESRGSLKRSLKVELNKYIKGQKLAGLSKLNLHNNVTDASWMNEVLSHRLYRDAGVPAPRTAYARVFVTVPAQYDKQYLGLYAIVEDVDRNFAEENFGAKKGALFKPVTPNLFADLGDDWKNYQQAYDAKTDLSEKDKRRLIEFARLVTSASDAEFAARLGDDLDLDEFARFMAVTVWLSNMDSLLAVGQNFYLYLDPRTHRFQFLPWDLDHSFGQFPILGSQAERENLSILKPWRGENRFLERVFKVEAFKKLYLARLDEFSKNLFKPERFDQQVDAIAAAIRPAVQEESAEKLARFDKVVAGQSVGSAGFGGPPPGGADGQGPSRRGEGGEGPRFGGPGGFMQPAIPIKPFVKVRAQSVIDQLAGKSPGQTPGEFGFGGGGGRGGPGGGPGGPGGFGPGDFLGRGFMTALDGNKDGQLTRDEFVHGFAKWFDAWNTDRSGVLTDEQLRAGINQDLAPFRGGPPGDPGFGPPGGTPPPRAEKSAPESRPLHSQDKGIEIGQQGRAAARPDDLPAVFRKRTPASLEDLKTIERHIKAMIPRLSRAVVAVQIGGATGSGVVVSDDGLVLTAAHVCGETNREVVFVFPDGSTARGKTLGMNHEVDAGMMKITNRGPWPHVETGDLDQARLGDWVLTFGHPGGFDPERPVVVRLGRLIRLTSEALQTDCTLSAGDSGGPLFDMRGRVIGIHSRISDSTAENFHVSVTAYHDSWDRLVKGESWGDESPPPRPWFGVRGVDHSPGCKLVLVEEEGPAFKAGLRIGDLVRKINSREVQDYATLKRFVAEAKPGDELKVEVQRDEKEMAFTVKIEARSRRR